MLKHHKSVKYNFTRNCWQRLVYDYMAGKLPLMDRK
jgi:hypothetical protein